MVRKSPIRIAWTAASLLAIVVAAWWFVLPISVGGRTALVVAQGISMQPMLHAGDLIVVRKADNSALRVGDVVLYPSNSLHRYVLHRIIKIDSHDRLTMKGDNNNFVDPERPARTSIIGKKAYSIAGAGKIPGVGSPVMAGISTALILLIVFAMLFKDNKPTIEEEPVATARPEPDHSRTAQPTSMRPKRRPTQRPAQTFGSYELASKARLIIAAAVGTVALLGASGLAWHAHHLPSSGAPLGSQPDGRKQADTYRHVGVFAYSAREPSAAIQADHLVTTGDAVFTNTVRQVDLNFDYHLEGKNAAAVTGTATLDMSIADDNGWQMNEQLDSVPVQAGAAHLSATLDMATLRTQLHAFEQASQTTPPIYRLHLHPRIVLDKHATPKLIAGSSFTPELALVLDPVRLRPETITGGDVADQYHPALAITDSSKTGAPAEAPKRTITRSVGYGLAVLALLLGMGIAATIGAGSIVPATAQDDDVYDDEGEYDGAKIPEPVVLVYADQVTRSLDMTEELPPAHRTVLEPASEPFPLTPFPARATQHDLPEPVTKPLSLPVAMGPREQLAREGIFHLPTSNMRFDGLPLFRIRDVDELIVLARLSDRPVMMHGLHDTDNWIVRIDDAFYVLTVPAPQPDASTQHLPAIDYDAVERHGWAA